MTIPDKVLKRQILRLAGRFMPVSELRERLCREFDVPRTRVRHALKELIHHGRLQYGYDHGVSFLLPALSRPFRVTPRIRLSPAAARPEQAAGSDVVLYLNAGAAFGAGDHPTTRLALYGLEATLDGPVDSVLDIGTGTGVLAIAALLLGASRAIAVDTDPCARVEALENARCNRMSERIRIAEGIDPHDPARFDVILANLRPPTLMRLCGQIKRRAAPNGRVVLSGFRPDEVSGVIHTYGKAGMAPRWLASTDGWSAVVLMG